MNKFETRENFEHSEPKFFLRQLLKDKNLLKNKGLIAFIKALLDKIQEYKAYNRYGFLRSILPGHKKGEEVMEPGAYDYTKTDEYEQKVNNLMKGLGVTEEYSDAENRLKYEVVKKYLEMYQPELDISKADVSMTNIGCIKIDENEYGIMSQNEFEQFCQYLESPEKLEELKENGLFYGHLKKPNYYIVDAKNEVYADFLASRNLEEISYDDYDVTEEVKEEGNYTETLLLESGFYSNEEMKFNYETGTIVNCYLSDPEKEIQVPEEITREVYNSEGVKEEQTFKVHEINMNSFDGIEAKKLVIPIGIDTINGDDTIDLSGIEKIEIDPKNPNFKMKNGEICDRKGHPVISTRVSIKEINRIYQQLDEMSSKENGKMLTDTVKLKDGGIVVFSLSTYPVDGIMQKNITAVYQNKDKTINNVIVSDNNNVEDGYSTDEDLWKIVNFINEKGIDRNKNVQEIELRPRVRSFAESLNRETKKDYGFKGSYYLVDSIDPLKYMELNSSRYKLNGRTETETTYRIYNGNQEVGFYSDKKEERTPKGYWNKLREEMKTSGGFSDQVVKLYSREQFEQYMEQLKETGVFKEEPIQNNDSKKKDEIKSVSVSEIANDMKQITEDYKEIIGKEPLEEKGEQPKEESLMTEEEIDIIFNGHKSNKQNDSMER